MAGSGRAALPRLLALSALVTLLGVAGCSDRAGDEGGAARDGATSAEMGGMSLVGTLGGADTAGYARATEARDFVFPDDHGPHPGFRTEWWYVTGNLSAEDGRDFGFQLTIFRNALAPSGPGGPSAWATNQAYMGHFAVTDVDSRDFRAAEVFARGSVGLAGAQAEPLKVWIGDWGLESVDGVGSGSPSRADVGTGGEANAGLPGGGSVFPLRLTADGDDFAVDLTLDAGKPVVLQGDGGLSRKGPEPGNASYYYALTRMPAAGRVVLDDEAFEVSGLAWLDREWSTSALSEGQVGWDWFALQLDDGWEMMVYRLRREDSTADPLSDGVLIDPEGRRIPLEWGNDVRVTPTGSWSSPVDGAEYPSGWRIEVPERGWELTVEPAVRDQELRLAFRYWEGAVTVEGRGDGGRGVEGRGYVELTGYAEGG